MQLSDFTTTVKVTLITAFICGLVIGANARADELPQPFVEGAMNYNLDANTDWYTGRKPTRATATIKGGLEMELLTSAVFAVYIYHESNPTYGYDRGQNGLGTSLKYTF